MLLFTRLRLHVRRLPIPRLRRTGAPYPYAAGSGCGCMLSMFRRENERAVPRRISSGHGLYWRHEYPDLQ